MPEKKTSILAALTETSVQTGSIEKIDFTRVKAKMMPNGEETHIVLDYGGIIDGQFLLSQAPPDNCLTVRRAVLDILGQIDLQKLCTNLEASAALVDVAYNACNGIGGAHENMYQLRTDIFDAVVDSVDMSDQFRKATRSVIMAMLSVYETLSSVDNCDLPTVRAYLSAISRAAKGLADRAEEMAQRFTALENKTLKEGREIVKIESVSIKEQEELQKQLADFKAQLDAFNVSQKELEKQITEAQRLYTKYDNEARELNQEAKTAEMIGAIVGGIGQIANGVSSAVAGFYGAQTPKISIGLPSAPAGGKTSPGGSVPTPGTDPPVATEPEVPDTPDVVACKTRLGSNKAELDLLKTRLPEYAAKLTALEKEKSSTDKTRSDSEIDTEIAATKDKQDKDTKRQAALEKEIADDTSYLKGKLAASLGIEVGKISKEMESKFENMGNNARSAAAAKDKLAEEMLRLKFELEGKNTEVLAKITEFTQRIKNASIEVIDLSVIINSLQLAVTCLSTVGSTLATVSLFWRSVEKACANLADSTVIEALTNKISGEAETLESLVKYVTSNTAFGRNWFIMECQWHALYLVCDAYYISCNSAKNLLDISLRRVETDRREHWKLAQEIAKDLEIKLQVTLRSAQSKDEDFKKRVALAQQEKEKMLLEFTGAS
ncbi:MAG: hypothetical protein LBR56_05725 [Sporomusaceae bacterium]|jgi:hypothetical protein|nr:hypothetical protein [Sporomusaceae bacterium]